MLMPWYVANPPVDFSTHAVIILRAGPQSYWGGGVWLDRIESNGAGTSIEYTVMVPSTGCPAVGGGSLNPTVAIRLPLPLPDPITWRRSERPIDCDWNTDSTNVRP